MKKICIVTTLWSSITNWIKPFLCEYDAHGIDVTIVCNMDDDYEKELKAEFPFIHTKVVRFPRGISFGGSLKSIFELIRFFKKEKFDLVQYSTPNASLYASVAAKICRIPVRLYCQWGMVYVTRRGLSRFIFKTMEKTICKNSTEIQPDSYGNLEFCRKEGLYGENNSRVIWNGSAKGLDLCKFDITRKKEFSAEIKQKYGFCENDTVIGFVGRLGREKGCNELFTAFRNIKIDYPSAKLLFVGPIEKENTIDPALLDYFKECDDIVKTGRVPDVHKFISAMDIFVLPSYREGFGMSVIEASAMGVPVVTTKYPGPSGGMIDGVTGIAVEVKNAASLENAIRTLISDKTLSEKMGAAGRDFATENFDFEIFKTKYIENRLSLLKIKE